jgi:hypothetical protein
MEGLAEMNEDLTAEVERRINELMRSNERRLIESQLAEVSVGGIILPPSQSQPNRPWSNHIEGSWHTSTPSTLNGQQATAGSMLEALRRAQEVIATQNPIRGVSPIAEAYQSLMDSLNIRNPPPTVPNITADEANAAASAYDSISPMTLNNMGYCWSPHVSMPGMQAMPIRVTNDYGPVANGANAAAYWTPCEDDPPTGSSAPIVNETSEEIERRIAEMAARVRDLFLQGNYTPRRGDIAQLTDNGWVLAGRNISLDVNTEGQAHCGHVVYDGERWIAGLTSMTPGWRELHPGDIAVNINGDWYLQGLGRMVATGIAGSNGDVAFYDGTSWSLQGTTTASEVIEDDNWKKLTDDDWEALFRLDCIGRFRVSENVIGSHVQYHIEEQFSILSMTRKNGFIEYLANKPRFFPQNADVNNAPLYDVRFNIDEVETFKNFGIIEERTQHERAIVL